MDNNRYDKIFAMIDCELVDVKSNIDSIDFYRLPDALRDLDKVLRLLQHVNDECGHSYAGDLLGDG